MSVYLYLLVTIFGFCSADITYVKPNESTHLTSCCTSPVDYLTEGVRSIVVYRKLRTLSVYPIIRRGKMHTLLYLSMLMLKNSSDIETNPGPRKPKYPCKICEKAVTWKQRGVACDDCQQWYYVSCMHMSTPVNEGLTNVSWHCDSCGMPNFSSSLFESFELDSTENSFNILDSTVSTGISSPGAPITCSSPVSQSTPRKTNHSYSNMKTLVVNFQSAKNKMEEIGNLTDSANPSIIIGTETWMHSGIHSSEIFPANYDVIRHDPKDGYGGVLLAIRRYCVFEKVDIKSDTESVFAKLTLDKNKAFIVGSLYRPPSSDIQYMDELCTTMHNIARHTRTLPSGWEEISTCLTLIGRHIQ